MGHFSEEFEARYSKLVEALEECQEAGGDIEKDMPEEWAEYQRMQLIIDTEFF